MRSVWIPLYLFLFFLVWKRSGLVSAAFCLLTTILAVAIADQICGSLLRGIIGRMRPSNPDNPLSQWVHIVNNHRGGKYGFPSCHAANTAAVATILSLWIKNRNFIIAIFLWSAIVSCSRVYLGVHYPSDICAGFLIGISIAYTIILLLRYALSYAVKTWPEINLLKSCNV